MLSSSDKIDHWFWRLFFPCCRIFFLLLYLITKYSRFSKCCHQLFNPNIPMPYAKLFWLCFLSRLHGNRQLVYLSYLKMVCSSVIYFAFSRGWSFFAVSFLFLLLTLMWPRDLLKEPQLNDIKQFSLHPWNHFNFVKIKSVMNLFSSIIKGVVYVTGEVSVLHQVWLSITRRCRTVKQNSSAWPELLHEQQGNFFVWWNSISWRCCIKLFQIF